jgi:probable F420-dependent oxidoreductase
MRDFDRGRGTLVALHGHGDDPASARAWGRRMAPAGWEVVAPGAPTGPDGVRSWFATGPRGADAGDLDRSLDRLAHLVDSVRASGRRVVVAGFSQGGALALASLRRPGATRPDALVAVCAFLAEAEGDVVAATAPGGGSHPVVPVLVVGGEADEDVPAFLGEDAAAVLAAEGHEVTVRTVPGGHEVGAATADDARHWITESLADGVRLSVQLPVDRVDAGAELVSGAAVADLAAAYEQLGADAAFVTDHPAPDARWLAAGGHHALEPTVALAVAATSTRHLLLHTNVYVLPYRNPFLAAKALASVDVVSGGRLVAGVAAGYLRPEFDALGADFDARGAALEESLTLLPRIWAEDAIASEGSGHRARAVTALPRPAHRPHPPLWVGGNSAAALRRAVTLAQGWSPLPTPDGLERAVRTTAIRSHADLAARLAQARELCESTGRTEPLTICFAPFSLGGYLRDPVGGLAPLAEEVRALAELGVDWVTLTVPGLTRREVIDRAGALLAACRR